MCHFYGTPVPLLRHFAANLIIFHAGGLLFFMSNIILEECSVVQPEMSLDALARDLGAARIPPHEDMGALGDVQVVPDSEQCVGDGGGGAAS